MGLTARPLLCVSLLPLGAMILRVICVVACVGRLLLSWMNNILAFRHSILDLFIFPSRDIGAVDSFGLSHTQLPWTFSISRCGHRLRLLIGQMPGSGILWSEARRVYEKRTYRFSLMCSEE